MAWLTYLLILLQLLLLLIAKMTRNWKTGLTLAFTGKIYFRILDIGLVFVLGLGLGSVALALHVSGLGLLALALTLLALLTSLHTWAL